MSHRTSGEAAEHGPQTRFESLRRDRQLRDDLPHLKNVFMTSEYRRCGISTYDFDDAWECLHTHHSVLDFQDENTADDVANLFLESSAETTRRVAVIEDISSDLIAHLVNLLEIDLEVFEEHLLNCGWQQHTPEPDPEPVTWVSKRVKRSHFSMNWYRPYKTNLPSQSMRIDYKTLIVQESLDLSGYDTKALLDAREQVFEYNTNTWRSNLNLDIKSSIWSGNHSSASELGHSTVLAGSERLTIWDGRCKSHDLTIVLTDAGFCSSPDQVMRERQTTSNRVYLFQQGNFNPLAVTRIRQSDHGPEARDTRANHRDDELPTASRLLLDGSRDEGVPPESRHSNLQADAAFSNTVRMELPDDIVDSASLATTRSEVASGDHLSINPDHSPTIREVSPSLAMSSMDSLRSRAERNVTLEFLPPSRAQPTKFIRNVASRCPLEHVKLDQARTNGFFVPLTTTREDFGTWVEHFVMRTHHLELKWGVAPKLFMIFYHDTCDFLESVEHYLDEMISASNNEAELEKKISLWRKMLDWIDLRIRQLAKDAPNFERFISITMPSRARLANSSDEAPFKALRELNKMIQRVQGHLRYANTVISSSISIAESRRGITEAESVTRITELAFIYVPLSFAASFFGMQVKELDPSTTSIVGFVGLAIGVVAISYATRLVIRSQIFVSSRQKMMASVRHDAKIQDAQVVRTRDFVVWIWHRCVTDFLALGQQSDYRDSLTKFFILLSGVIVMISVWASAALVRDMKVAISLAAVILFVSFFAFTCATNFRRLRKMVEERRRRRQIIKRRRAMRDQISRA